MCMWCIIHGYLVQPALREDGRARCVARAYIGLKAESVGLPSISTFYLFCFMKRMCYK